MAVAAHIMPMNAAGLAGLLPVADGALHPLLPGQILQGRFADQTFFPHSFSPAFSLQIIWVMVPMGEKLPQTLGWNRIFTAKPMMVEVSMML